MLGKNKLSKITKKALLLAKENGASDAEVVLQQGVEELTRFANSEIHQSISLTDSLVHIRVAVGKKVGVSRCNRLDAQGIRDCVKKAIELANYQQIDPHYRGLPAKSSYIPTHKHYQRLSHIGPKGRAKAIDIIIKEAKKVLHHASGAFSESENETLIANSNGVLAYHRGLSASLTTILTGDKSTGFASQSGRGGSEIIAKNVARQAVYKATHGECIEVPPGEYEVILEPPAVAELMDFFAWFGPNARIFHEDVSFYQGNLGKQVFHESLTILDDPLHKLGYPIGFDYEGTPKRPIVLVKAGTLNSVVYDSYHANKYKMENTGHALLAPNTWGPTPTHLVVAPGKHTKDQLIKNVKKGLLITRFWYTRVVQHKQLMLTGMTRDGTFYIENGKITGRVRNLRYTQSIVEAYKDIRGIGNKLELHGSEGSPSLVPHLHIGTFRFTGITKHG